MRLGMIHLIRQRVKLAAMQPDSLTSTAEQLPACHVCLPERPLYVRMAAKHMFVGLPRDSQQEAHCPEPCTDLQNAVRLSGCAPQADLHVCPCTLHAFWTP